MEAAQTADPVPAFRRRLISDGVLSEDDAANIENDADSQVTAAVAFADNSPDPAPAELFDFAYATEVVNAPRALPGQPLEVGL